MPPKISPAKPKKKGTRRRKAKVKKETRFTLEELNEEIDTFLSTHNPYMSENCVEFDRKIGTFKPILDYRKPVLVLKYQGTMRKKKSEGAEILFGEDEGEEKEEVIRNKFNFRNVEMQTVETHPSDYENQIDSSLFPVLKFKGTVSKSKIISAYEIHEKKKKETSQYSWIHSALRKMVKYVGRKSTPFQGSNQKYLRLCERMVDQNLSEAGLDYSYYDNPNDDFRPNFGSLLPLWIFSCNRTRGMRVTAIAWSVHYSDLFAVSYRTFKEDEGDEDDLGIIRESGFLCIYSLKGPNYPEKIFQSSAAVLCMSFHPGWSHLLAAGCEGGTLNIYDLRRERNDPAGTSKMTEKTLHHDSVNELTWLPSVLPQKFCTVSTDGNILSWQFIMNDLSFFDDVMSLRAKDWPGETPPKRIETEVEPLLTRTVAQDMGIKMPGLSMSINPYSGDLFVVGTETGVIYRCSFDGKTQLESYEDHKRSVSRVHWNPYHQRVFLSSSDDMTVRIWDSSMRESLFDFFFENEVRDASWAPFSSTLFAAISGNSMLYVFDIAVDKKEAIGNYVIYSPKEEIDLTTMCFHPTKPVIMVGDERGHVISFKLSPNLRSSLKARETLEEAKFIEAEVDKMEKLLAPAKDRIKKQ